MTGSPDQRLQQGCAPHPSPPGELAHPQQPAVSAALPRQMPKAVTVALVEDHQLLVAALASALRAEGFAVVVPALTTMAEVTAALVAARPDVALVDLDLRGIGRGDELVAPLSDAGCSVVIVSATSNEADVGRCMELGAVGWVPKSAPFDDLRAAVLAVAAGDPVIGAGERLRLIDVWRAHRQSESTTRAPFERLSNRERAVLGELMDGRSVERIAKGSFVSEATVRSQVRAILLKLGVNSQLEAVATARRAGWDAPTD